MSAECFGLGIRHLVGTDDDAQLATSLNGVGFRHTRITHGNGLKVVQTLDVSLDNLATGTRTSATDGVAHLHDGREKRLHLHFVVVGTDGIANIGFFLVFLGDFRTVEGVRIVGVFVGHFSDVVQQSGAFRFLRIQTEFSRHHSTEVGRFTGVLQQVLTVGRTIFHLSDDANQFGVQAVDTEVDGRALTRLDNFVVELFFDLRHDFLDAGRVDATVADELVERQTADFAANRVERRDNDGLGRIIDDEFHTAGGLQSANVATFTTDDATFDVVVVEVEHRHAVLDGRFRRHALNRLNHDFLSLCVGIEFRLVNNFVDVTGGVGTSLVLQAFNQAAFGFVGTQSRHFLEFRPLLALHFFEFFLLDSKQFLLVIDALLVLLHLLFAATEFFLTLVQRYFALFQLVFALLNALVALLHLFFEFALLVEELLAHLQELFLLNHFSLLVGGCNHLIIFSLHYVTENSIADKSAYYEAGNDCN